MKGEQIFDCPFVAFDNSDLNVKMLDLIDNIKHLVSRVTILHVHNPNKIYMPLNLRGNTVYNTLRDRYPENDNPRLAIQLKELGDKSTNVIILENFVATSSSILFLGYIYCEIASLAAKDSSPGLRISVRVSGNLCMNQSST